MNPGAAPVGFVGLLPMVLMFGFFKRYSLRSDPRNPGFEQFKLEYFKFESFKPGEGPKTSPTGAWVPNKRGHLQ